MVTIFDEIVVVSALRNRPAQPVENRLRHSAKIVRNALGETTALTPEMGEIVRFCAVNRWDENDEFKAWTKPTIPLTAEAERILDVTNEQLARCTPGDLVLDQFLDFIHGAELVGDRLEFDLAFLKAAISGKHNQPH